MLFDYPPNLIIGLIAGFVALVIASITDMKTREVPDWLNFSLSFFAIGYAVILSVLYSNAGFVANAVCGLTLGLAVGLFMFYTGQWGGGDSKLIIGLCAILGVQVPMLSSIGGNDLILAFFVNTLFVGAIYGLGFSIWKAIVHFSEWKKEALSKFKQRSVRVSKIVLIIFMILALLNYVLSPGLNAAFILGIAVLMMFMLYLWIFVSCVEKVHMVQPIDVKKLTEGDWIVEPVTKKGKTILKPTRIGITKDEIGILKKNRIKKVIIKVGIPFVPSFLLAYILMIVFGNWLALFF
ncbi:prepilin peptidase [Candidatus Woesearchaeota archaeon]|nr:prepilin peptidase [Candidatus Woesearchaeota archaeon]